MAEPEKHAGPGPLTGKVAGQPVWLWIVGVVVLAVGVQWYRQRAAAVRASSATMSAAPLAQDPATMGTGTLPAGAGTPSAQAGPVMSTEQWLAAAMNAVKNAGEDPIHASRALNAFLNGGNLSYADTLVVNAALDAVGTPPGYSSIPPGTWADRTMPAPTTVQPSGGIVGFVQPANSPTVFAKYANGALASLGDANSAGQTIRSAAANGINTNVQVLPVSDPIFQQSDVGQNQQAAIQYLWGQKWAQYVAPGSYVGGRSDIVRDPTAIAAANAAWERSQSVLPSTWSFIGQAPSTQSDAYAKAAYAAAFPTTS